MRAPIGRVMAMPSLPCLRVQRENERSGCNQGPPPNIYTRRTTAEAPLQQGSSIPRVVIVGGGFGGLYAARALAKAPVQITLVDKRNYHLFRPMLYQVATGLLSADEIAPPLRIVFSRQENINVVLSEVTGVDTVNRRVLLPECELSYDYLILATGIQ